MMMCAGDPVCITTLVYSSYFLASQSLVVYVLLLGAAFLLLMQLLTELITGRLGRKHASVLFFKSSE